jgi:hypothetical protein
MILYSTVIRRTISFAMNRQHYQHSMQRIYLENMSSKLKNTLQLLLLYTQAQHHTYFLATCLRLINTFKIWLYMNNKMF